MLHGGVGLYIKQGICYSTLKDFFNDEFDALWVWLRPPRLPCGVLIASLRELFAIRSFLMTMLCWSIFPLHSPLLKAFTLSVGRF